jgi:hypothetical protein
MANPYNTTVQSSRISSRRGSDDGADRMIAFCAAHPVARPSRPPAMAYTMTSVSSCVASRRRDAPNADRTAISVPRPSPRASSRFATFTHPISSTTATAPNIANRYGRAFPMSRSVIRSMAGSSGDDGLNVSG